MNDQSEYNKLLAEHKRVVAEHQRVVAEHQRVVAEHQRLLDQLANLKAIKEEDLTAKDMEIIYESQGLWSVLCKLDRLLSTWVPTL